MFATLRYGEQDGDLRAVEQSTTFPVQGQGSQHYACFECRHRKLKCTGEKSGCSRCVASGSECAYPRAKTSKREGQRTKRTADDVEKLPEVRASGPSHQSEQIHSPRPAASKARRDALPVNAPTQHASPEHQSLSIAPVAPMLPDNGSNEMLFSARDGLGYPQLHDLYSMEGMLDTQMREILEVSDLDHLPRNMTGPTNCADDTGEAPEPFTSASGGFDGGMDFADMFDLDDAAMSAGSPVTTIAPDVQPTRKRTTSMLAASRANTQPNILTPEASRSSSSHRAVTPDDREWSSLPTQRITKPRSGPPQHSSFDFAAPHAESRCMKQAMSLSYKAHFCSKQGVRTSTAALFSLLSEFRQCVQALNTLAACARCTSSAPFMTFLADVCERLGRGLVNMTTLSTQVNIDGRDMGHQLTDGYVVDTQEEFAALFGMIAARHLAVLRQVAAKIKQRAASEKCRPALVVLQETDKRLAGIEQVLKSAMVGDSCPSIDLDEEVDVPRFRGDVR